MADGSVVQRMLESPARNQIGGARWFMGSIREIRLISENPRSIPCVPCSMLLSPSPRHVVYFLFSSQKNLKVVARSFVHSNIKSRPLRTYETGRLTVPARAGSSFLRALSILAILVLAGLSGCAKKPLPPAHWQAGPDVGALDLLGVYFIDQTTGWAVGGIDPKGAGGLIYQTNDSGGSWHPIARTPEILTSVFFVNAKTGWVAGYAGRIDRTDDGGQTWRSERPERGSEILNSLFFVSERVGWVAGGSGLLLKTGNGGESWEQIPTGRVEDFWTVRFSPSQKGLIVGEDGLILATSDGGAHWEPRTSGTTVALMGLAISPKGRAVAVGEHGMILVSSDWSRWTAVASGVTETLDAVAGTGDNMFWSVGAKGTTLESTDGGSSWKQTPPVSSRDLLSIGLADSSHGVAVGQRGCTQLLRN
jgi:photosystem II stability/assembly factor-like uncharacterized protein